MRIGQAICYATMRDEAELVCRAHGLLASEGREAKRMGKCATELNATMRDFPSQSEVPIKRLDNCAEGVGGGNPVCKRF